MPDQEKLKGYGSDRAKEPLGIRLMRHAVDAEAAEGDGDLQESGE